MRFLYSGKSQDDISASQINRFADVLAASRRKIFYSCLFSIPNKLLEGHEFFETLSLITPLRVIFMLKTFYKTMVHSMLLIGSFSVNAGDLPGNGPLSPLSMPVLGNGEYGTDIDNENNAHTGLADGDLDNYLFNDDPAHPIEFNIALPAGSAGVPGTLRMDVYDVDTNTVPGNPEIDEVFVNGIKVGVLNGSDDTWGVNQFAIPPGVLKAGKNLIEVRVDTGNPTSPTWAVEIDWGIIKIQPKQILINRAWVAPARQNVGKYVNFFAEVTGKPKEVNVYGPGNTLWVKLSDPDGDNTWSGQWKIPATAKPQFTFFTMRAYNQTMGIASKWPYLKITP